MTMTPSFSAVPAPARHRRAAPRPADRPSRTPARPLQTPARRPALPSALQWQDARLPVLGHVRAAGWLPTMLLAVLAVALVYLVQTSGVATTGYDIQRLQSERSEWQLRNEQLRLELSKLRSLPWVEAEAVGRLGMQRPDQLTYVVVDLPAASVQPATR